MNVTAERMKLACQSVEGAAASASIENDVGLRGIAAVLPAHTRDLEELQRGGLLVSDRSVLEELGFEKVHVCDAVHDVEWLALESARLAMARAEVEPAEIDVLIMASALSETHLQDSDPVLRTPIEELLGSSTIGRAGCRKSYNSIMRG